MSQTAPQVSVVIPVYNEEDNVAALVAQVGQAMLPTNWSFVIYGIAAFALRAVTVAEIKGALRREKGVAGVPSGGEI